MHIVVCYPFLDFRFLTDSAAEPEWLDGYFYNNVGSLGAVTRGAWDGREAELRLDGALLFSGEYRTAGPTERPKRRRKPDAGEGLVVVDRCLLADMYGQVRVEVTLQALDNEPYEETLERVLTTPVYIVRAKHTHMISAGFQLARTYLEQSAKTSAHSGEVTTKLLKEGAGSPFLIVLRSGVPVGKADGQSLRDRPATFAAVTFRLIELAGRPTGVWQLWLGDNLALSWAPSMRMLCRIICQLSEVTSLLRVKSDPQALLPYLLNEDKTTDFFRVREGQLRRKMQGDWLVAGVLSVANHHLKVAVEDLDHSREQLEKVMPKDVAGSLATTITRIEKKKSRLRIEAKPLEPIDKTRLVDLLAARALNRDGYFRHLIQQADLKKDLKFERQDDWSGEAKSVALRLVDWALSKDANRGNRKYSALASILIPELESLNFQEAATVIAIILKYRLVDANLLDELRRRFNVPIVVYNPEPAASDLGPDFEWRGPEDALSLQSWLRPEPPDYLDVGDLTLAIERANGVCLVSVGGTGECGTGVLIGRRFVLTNHHVLVPLGSQFAPTTHAKSIKLQFGVIRNSNAEAKFELDSTDPVPAFSPTEKLDYALLRVSPDIDTAKMLKAAEPTRQPPALKSSLNILQHPFGAGMKLAPSRDAVTYVDTLNGILQYVTRTDEGSSGAPCFDSDWHLAAIHHAERKKVYGTIREGILIDSILKEVEARVDQAELGLK